MGLESKAAEMQKGLCSSHRPGTPVGVGFEKVGGSYAWRGGSVVLAGGAGG